MPRPAAPSRRLAAPLLLGPLLLGMAALPLGACSTDLSRTFGLTRDSPDEFTVTTAAPLSLPPSYTLRPPQPGAPRPQEQSEAQQAQEALVPQTALTAGTAGAAAESPGQEALVAAAGPAAPRGIRAEVNQEAAASQDRSFTDRLLFWRKPATPGVVVDPTKETQRLRQNAALGESPETGETPIIQPQKRGWLQGIF